MELFCPVHRITLILRTAQTLHAHVVDPSTHLRHSRNTLRAVSPLSSAAAQRDSFTVVIEVHSSLVHTLSLKKVRKHEYGFNVLRYMCDCYLTAAMQVYV